MSLIIATGSNIGQPIESLNKAKKELSSIFTFIAESEIFKSEPMGDIEQPEFYNQVLEFQIPQKSPSQVMQILLDIENKMGRVRKEKWGPRVIDLDIIFWGTEQISNDLVKIPHPFWSERSFVVKPLQQLPFFKIIKKYFTISEQFKLNAYPINKKKD